MPAGPGRGHKKKKKAKRTLVKRVSECPICGLKKPDTPHHIIPRAGGGSDGRNNIIWLCKNCHNEIEEHWRYWLPYFKRLVAKRNNLFVDRSW